MVAGTNNRFFVDLVCVVDRLIDICSTLDLWGSVGGPRSQHCGGTINGVPPLNREDFRSGKLILPGGQKSNVLYRTFVHRLNCVIKCRI